MTCPTCQDTKLVPYNSLNPHGVETSGQMFPCPDCPKPKPEKLKAEKPKKLTIAEEKW